MQVRKEIGPATIEGTIPESQGPLGEVLQLIASVNHTITTVSCATIYTSVCMLHFGRLHKVFIYKSFQPFVANI